MTPQTPACELLAKQSADYRDWLWVAPPRDPWLERQPGRVWSADLAVIEAWRAHGRTDPEVHAELSPPDLASRPPGAVLFWPKSHALGAWWLAALNAALPAGTPIEVVGENQGGIKRVPKVLAAMGLPCEKRDNARRCVLFATRAETLPFSSEASWETFKAGDTELASHPGVFGHGKLDAGTRLLMASMEDDPMMGEGGRALDVGCGDGVLSVWLARRGYRVTACDISAFAVAATQRTLALNGLSGQVVQSDVYRRVDGEFAAIVSNPPFHQERAIDYGPAERLILEAPSRLVRGGSLTLVANAFLPYPDWLERAFGQFEILADDRRFRVYRALKA